MAERLFVAIVPPAVAIAELATAVRALGKLPGVSWEPTVKWHVTLQFLGATEVPTAGLGTALDAIGATTLELAIGGAGTFAARGRPSVLWAGLRDAGDRLADLAAAVRGAVAAAGVPVGADGPLFRPHLTLARLDRRVPDDSVRTALSTLVDVTGPDFTVSSISLVRSRSGTYDVLHQTRLTTPPRG